MQVTRPLNNESFTETVKNLKFLFDYMKSKKVSHVEKKLISGFIIHVCCQEYSWISGTIHLRTFRTMGEFIVVFWQRGIFPQSLAASYLFWLTLEIQEDCVSYWWWEVGVYSTET